MPQFAVHEESIYQTGPHRQLAAPPSDDRQSKYQAFDDFLNDSGDEEDERNPFKNPSPYSNNQSVPLAAPRPGYAANVNAIKMPMPAATPDGRSHGSLQTPVPASLPHTPHPLDAPVTPIAPAFARPNGAPASGSIKFSEKPIMRGDTEGNLLPKRGEKGDDFWRRFSMVVQEENKHQHKASKWLAKTEAGESRLNRSVWIIGVILLICIAGAIGLGFYISKNNNSHEAPETVGGKQSALPLGASSTNPVNGDLATSSVLHVSPTLTLHDKREFVAMPSAVPDILEEQVHRARANPVHRRKSHLNRDNLD